MAVNLSGRADATLVKAATDAAMANVPVDVSKIHERLSKSHAAMTASVGKSWGNALKSIGEIGGALVQKAKDKKDDIGEPFENADVDIKEVETGVDTTPTTIENEEGELIEQDDPYWDEEGYIQGVHGMISPSKGFQALPAFVHVDKDDNPSTITVANTEQHIETLRDQISGLPNERKAGLEKIEREAIEQGLSSKEIKTRKQKFKLEHKEKKRKLNRIKDNTNNSNRRFAEFNEVLKSQIENRNINFTASGMYGANKMNFANALLSKGKPLTDGSKAVQGYDDKGNMVFMYVDKNNRPIKSGGKNLTLAEGDAGSLLVQKSTSRPIVEALFNDDAIKRYQTKTKYGDQVHMNAIEKVVKNEITDSTNPKETFLDFAFMPTYGKNTLADEIHNVKYDNGIPVIDPENPTTLAGVFIKALGGISGNYSKENPHPYDMDNDGDFDAEDWGTEENYIALARRALSGDELDISIPLLEMHYKNQVGEIFDAAFDADSGDGDGGDGDDPPGILSNYIINNTNIKGSTWQNSYVPFINRAHNAKDGDTLSSPTGKKYKMEKGKYYLQTSISPNEYDMDTPMSFHDLAVLDGWDNYVNTKPSTEGARKFGGKWYNNKGQLLANFKPQPE